MIRDIIVVDAEVVGADFSGRLNAIGIACQPTHEARLPHKLCEGFGDVRFLEISLPVQVRIPFNRLRHYRKLFHEVGIKEPVRVLVSMPEFVEDEATLGNGFRSKVSKIMKQGNAYVSKQYFSHYTKYFNRELNARRLIISPAVSELVVTGDYEFVTTFHESAYTFSSGLFEYYDVEMARQIMEIVSGINQQGFAIVDWNPDSFIIGDNGQIKVVDFEFCQETERTGTSFENSVDYIGARKFGLECPGRKDCGYKDFWFPVLGISYKTLMHGSDLEIRFKRLLHWHFIRFPRFVVSQIERQLSEFRKWLWFLRHRDKWVEL